MTARAVLTCLLALLSAGSPNTQDFETEGEGLPYVLDQAGEKPGPEIKEGSLLLVAGMWSRGPLENSIGFARAAEGTHRRTDLSFEFSLAKGAHGAGVALLPTEAFGTDGAAPRVEAWEEPNLPGTFAVGIDTFDPPTSHWFDANGNVHDRPERTISLHWDGREVANALSPVEFRDGEGHRFQLTLESVPGGALVSVGIDDEMVYEERFVAGVRAGETRLAIGGRTGPTATTFSIDDVAIRHVDPAPVAELSPEPVRVRTFERAVIHRNENTARGTFELPAADVTAARVLLHLTLGPGPGGWDNWDRRAAVYVYPEGGERIEIVRFMTPFRREYTWTADVTDYRFLLAGNTDLGVYVSTMAGPAEKPEEQTGFAVTVDLDYVPGTPEREAFAVLPLWDTSFHFGNTAEAIAAAFPEEERAIPEGTTGAKLRLLVTGHGGFGEFTPADRTVTVNGTEFSDTLWRTDVWLNPCRPQGGTWKFDRTGWAPGDLSYPWDLEVGDLLEPGGTARLRYLPAVYGDKPEKIAADHWIHGHLILYR